MSCCLLQKLSSICIHQTNICRLVVVGMCNLTCVFGFKIKCVQFSWNSQMPKSVLVMQRAVNFSSVFVSKRFFSDFIEDDFYLEDTCNLDSIENGQFDFSFGNENIYIIQPILKKDTNTSLLTKLQLDESFALVESLPNMSVTGSTTALLKNPNSTCIFSIRKLNEIAEKVKILPQIVSSIFVNVQQLYPDQQQFFKKHFEVGKVYDRYTLVLQIFKLRAKTKEAKLQVALAEIPYIKNNLRLQSIQEGPIRQKQSFVSESYFQQLKNEFQRKEVKLRKRLKFLAQQRDIHRQVREKSSVPIIAIVGYTNAGKTSLIKALTRAEKIQPKDHLFATLDVTSHSATFPNNLSYVLVDTVGFLSDLPLELFDAFSATMEDMLSADVIVHVRDESHPDRSNQLKNVLSVLSKLRLPASLLKNIVEVRNKVDLVDDRSAAEVIWPKTKKIFLKNGQLDLRPIVVCRLSATLGTGLANFVTVLQNVVMTVTARCKVEMIVPAEGSHHQWLSTYCCVEGVQGHGDFYLKLIVIVTEAQLNKFLHKFQDVEVINKLPVDYLSSSNNSNA